MHTSNHLVLVTTFLAACCSISAIRAEVYRCMGNDGHISYQQIRCHQNSKPLSINHNRTGWSGLRNGEQALLDGYRKKDAGYKRNTQSNSPETDKESKACWTRKAQLDSVKAKLRRGYNIKESENLHQQRSDHEDYLDQFCAR